MKKKKIIVYLLASIILGMQLNYSYTIAYADVNNKGLEVNNNNQSVNLNKVKNINFNKNELRIGETLEVYVDIEKLDNASSVYAQFWFPGNPLYYELKYNEKLGLYTANIKIEESFKYKTLDLIAIEIRNAGGNNIEYQSNLCVTILDEKGIADNEKPIINSININKNEIMVGELLEILVDAIDDASGIKEIKSSIYVNGQYEELRFSYDEAKKIYKSYFEITEDLKYKTIRLNNVVVTDNADKSITWEEGIDISVLQDNGGKDHIKPIVKSVNFDKGEYKVGDFLKLYVDTYDNESGIQFC